MATPLCWLAQALRSDQQWLPERLNNSDNSNYYLFSCTIVQNIVINMVIDILHKHNCISEAITSKNQP
jgi:hypothetical protein